MHFDSSSPAMTGPDYIRASHAFFGLGGVVIAAVFDAYTGLFASSAFVLFSAIAVLVFGLPHGALDIALLRRAGVTDARQIASATAIYLLVAAAVGAIWFYSPTTALATFLIVGVVHFAHDWAGRVDPLLGFGVGMAIVACPSLVHGNTVEALFELLGVGDHAATMVALLRIIAPVALATAGAAVIILHAEGDYAEAIKTAVCVCAMTLLTPLAGFVLFFCAFHSPSNYAHTRRILGVDNATVARRDTVLLSVAAFGLALGIATAIDLPTIDARMVGASFITLSVLTVPHMLAGVVADWLSGRRLSDSHETKPNSMTA